MKTFKHSGSLGDIIYSLPIMRALGGGILYLDIKGGADDPVISKQCPDGETKFGINQYTFLVPLLEVQQYIDEVLIWRGEEVDFNLDNFRLFFNGQRNLIDCHGMAFGLSPYDFTHPWLHVPHLSIVQHDIIVARNFKLCPNYLWFEANKKLFSQKATHVGTKQEHQMWEWIFGPIQHLEVTNAYELAQAIQSSRTFVNNSSFPLSLAIGLGHKDIIQEVDPKVPVTVFPNYKGMRYV